MWHWGGFMQPLVSSISGDGSVFPLGHALFLLG